MVQQRGHTTVHFGSLAEGAEYVLRSNDRGRMTVAAPRLYPHLWSWDAAFVAIGLARLSVPRAVTELRTVLSGQWKNGMIPHIQFSDSAGYFPGPDRWRSEWARHAPTGVATSGICQPPVHALAVAQVVGCGRERGGADRLAAEQFLTDTFDAWFNWHAWLASVRDPYEHGMVEIHHGWESGLDNSPRWDHSYAMVAPGAMEPFERTDLHHVADHTQRPSDYEYSQYAWLIDQMRSVGYDDELTRASIDFRVRDVLMSAILAAASDVLAELGESIGRLRQAAELRAISERFRAGVTRAISPVTGLARDFDVRSGEWIHTATVAGFAPLLCCADRAIRDRQLRVLTGPQWLGHDRLAFALPTSTSPTSPAFRRTTYWRGPVWPVLTWLLGWGLRRFGDDALAEQLRQQSLQQLAHGDFAEYYDPFSGAPLGSRNQSWTAAVALDWLTDR
ncbi:hypothetical protein M6D93_06605 [Jatrophihabitans telluris]|uniref:Mannosylglycerate hydrolase MGH1-like glycoside hydrolase domain-containing protein n=1 Tax=Jatrophihabitans telluris TaxID=2038343 RepID=A0ABY4R2V7_9ACTN|nr:glycoside hydrolase 100 family protein [Jatrophihabitans telluris]UQX89667.1 hypothetical protein M6D93_06605 [Jatrophihabitans telluris]